MGSAHGSTEVDLGGSRVRIRRLPLLTWMGGDYFQVNADRTYSRATMADTRCGNSNNSG
jgi:hypothetical protein